MNFDIPISTVNRNNFPQKERWLIFRYFRIFVLQKIIKDRKRSSIVNHND